MDGKRQCELSFFLCMMHLLGDASLHDALTGLCRGFGNESIDSQRRWQNGYRRWSVYEDIC